MDIAKYMTTALLLSPEFGNMKNQIVVIDVIIASAITLIFGLMFVRNANDKEEK